MRFDSYQPSYHVFALCNAITRGTWGRQLTKFLARHCLRAGSTGFRSSFASISCAFVRPGSALTRNLSAHRATLESLTFSILFVDP